MKRSALLSAILLFAMPCAIYADEAAAPQEGATSHQAAYLNLPEEKRAKFEEIVGEAVRLFQQKRIFETLEQVHEANKIFDQSPELMNLEASCYVEMRNFDRALEVYQAAEKLSPDNPSIKFNIAEVLFVTQQWEQSHERFTALMAQIPVENIALSRLVEFKILLCKIRLGREQEAFVLANKYDYLDDSPFHYYANAALAYEKEDLVKAEEWIAICQRIFRDPNIVAPWQDTMVEFGYIKSFYGSEGLLEE